MHEVLGLFNSNEWRWLWIVEHHEVGKQLHSAIGSESCEDWIFKLAILELQQQTAVSLFFSSDRLKFWHALR